MWRSRKDNLKRRMLSGILACLLVATSLTNTVGVISAFAAQGTDAPRVSYKYDDLVDDNGKLDKLVQINVQAENESFLPGSEMVLKVYVQNLSDQYLTGGSLKWNGKGLEEAGFLDEEEEDIFNGPGWDSGDSTGSDTTGGQDGGLMEELGNFSVTGLRKSVALRVDDTTPADSTDGEEGQAPEEKPETIGGMDFTEITEIQDNGEDDSDEPETDEEGKRIKGIELAPGEVYETRFYGTVEDLDSIVTRKVTFEFLAGVDGNDQKLAQDKAEFTYNTGMALVLPVEFEDGPALMTNELNTLYIRTRFEDEKILDEYTWDVADGDEDEATPADAQRHEITVATMSNGDGDSSEGTTPANMKYSIVTYGAKLLGIEAWRDEDKSDWGEVATGVSFRVADGTEPGVYFGQVTTSIRRDGKNYKTTQGFHFFVLGDGQIVLKGNVGGAEIQVKGDREHFPEGDMLSLKVTEVPEEKIGLVQEAMAQKADELGVSVDKMMAVDIKVIADGLEQELRGDVQVTFSNLQMQSLDGSLGSDETADAAEANDAAEAEEFEEISNHSVFGLRKAVAQNDQVEEESVADDLAVETEGQGENGGEGKEESSLAVWHFDEDNSSIDEMDSETNDDGDVVMTTEHFSIFIVVNVPSVKEVPVTIEHWAEVDDWKFDDNSLPLETVVRDRLYPGTPSGKTVYDKTLKKIYLDDVTTMPNGAGTGISYEVAVSKWSKVALGGNYKVKSVTIINSKYPEGKTVLENNSGIDKLELAATNNVIKIIYEPTVDNEVKGYADFHDYNVAIDNANGGVNNTKVGINSSSLSGGVDPKRIYVGIGLTDTNGSTYGHKANIGPNTIGIMKNIPKDKLSDNQIEFNYPDPGLFATGDIITTEEWKGNTEVDYYAKKYLTNYQLGFARKGDNYTLRAVYDAAGNDTRGKYADGRALPTLDVIKLSYSNGDTKLYSNLFWPLDNVSYGVKGKDRDYLYGIKQSANDNSGKYNLGVNDEVNKNSSLTGFANTGHNWFFGMRFDVDFTIGDYDGDMNYYFRGDDDLWLFIDGVRVKAVDLGGIHSSKAAYVNFKDWMAGNDGKPLFYKKNANGEYIKDSNGKEILDRTKKHTMTVFFMERGATGSCCYMSFTLPNAAPVPSTSARTVSKTVSKNWIDGNNIDRQRPQFILVQLQQDGVDYGNPVRLDSSNGWKYTWSNLPEFKEVSDNTRHVYTIKEISTPPGYSTSISGFSITNTLVGDIKVEKEWKDEDNAAQSRPGSIQIQLYKSTDGGKTKAEDGEPITLDNSNGWKYSWTDKPLYTTNAQKIIYSVEEVSGDWLFSTTNPTGWYVGTVNGDQDEGFTITNTYKPYYISEEVEKVWNDDNNKFGLQPAEITVVIYQGTTQYDSVILPRMVDEKKVWEYRWNNLPKYYYTKDSNGVVTQNTYEYTVSEVINASNGAYYTTAYKTEDTTEGKKVTITNTLQKARLRVGKWIDNDTVPDDVMEDKFIITVVGLDSEFETGVVLQPAGHGLNKNATDLNSDRLSKYIEVPVKANGANRYEIGEMNDLKEYTPSNPFVTHYSGTGIFEGKIIDVKPGGDDIVLVHNIFNHKDYFHNDHDVSNKFNGKGEKPLKVAQSQTVSLFAEVPERKTYDEPEKIDEDTRLT